MKMDESKKSFVEWWISEEYIWDLVSAVKLLLGIDPSKDKTNIDLSGNEKATRIYAWAIKKIKEGELTTVGERKSDTGEIQYRVLRDDFIKWAHKTYKNEGKPLFDTWKAYKNKPDPDSKVEKQRLEWQQKLDEMFLQEFEDSGGANPNHSKLCRRLADEEYPKKEGRDEYIRRLTQRRDGEWILGKLGKMKNSQLGDTTD